MLLIFDCDGVLRSVSWEGIYDAYRAIIRFMDKDPEDYFHNLAGFQQWINLDWHVNMEKIGDVTESHYPEILRIFHEINDPLICTFPWVEKIFRELSSRHTIAVLSASSSGSIRKSLEMSAEYITLFVGSDNVKKIKPDPEGIHHIMAVTGFSDAIMIGDTEQDIWAGQNAGVKTGAVDWGIRRIGTYLVELDPDHVFHSPEDLLAL